MSPERIPVIFESWDVRAESEPGLTIKQASAAAGVALDAPCGGLGTCGRCIVWVSGGVEPPTADELVLLGEQRVADGVRLACRARLVGPATIRRITAEKTGSLRIVAHDDIGPVAVEPPSERGVTGEGPLLGAVVDIGTTSVVAALVDLSDAAPLGSASVLNPQHPFGHDVMTRISHAATAGTGALRTPIVEAVQGLIGDVLDQAGHPAEKLREIAIAGNTTMIHLLLGIDPAPLGVAPYEPAFLDPVERPAAEIGLDAFPCAGVYLLPGISAFVGADITAGIIATGIADAERCALLVDLGTNGEMVLRTPSGLVGASTAAGPALEGASIAYGMRAETGAIERVSLEDDKLRLETIDGVRPRGLCGSGLLDLIAVLLDAGVIDESGRLRGDVPHVLADAVREIDGGRAFEVADGVYLTQRDVRQVQLANAAISSGIDLLLDAAGTAPEDVDELVVAGGFGYHVKAAALVRMGMIPAAWHDRVRFAGNTAKSGALMALVSTEARRRTEAVARHVTTIDLAEHPDFQTRFVGAMRFPASAAIPPSHT